MDFIDPKTVLFVIGLVCVGLIGALMFFVHVTLRP